MAHKVVFRRLAEQRLTELATYISREASPTTATHYLDRIYDLCMALADFSERGRPRDDILRGLRTISMDRRVTIAYRVHRDRVEILTIAYAGRDLSPDLGRKTKSGPAG